MRSIIGRGPAVARNWKLFVWAFLVIIILTACGSGGGGGNSGSSGSQTIIASFTPDVANPTDNSISLVQKSVQGDLITLDCCSCISGNISLVYYPSGYFFNL